MARNSRPSKAEIRRRIRQKQQPTPPAPPLPADIAEYVAGYAPRNIDSATWDKVRPFVLDTLACYEPTALESARQRLSALTAYAGWAEDKGYELTRDALLDYELIEAFTDTADLAKTTAANYRSRLRGITSKVHPAGRGHSVSVAVAHRAVKPPLHRAGAARTRTDRPDPAQRDHRPADARIGRPGARRRAGLGRRQAPLRPRRR